MKIENMINLFLTLCMLLSGWGCKEDRTETVPFLSVGVDTVDFGAATDSKNVKVETNREWTVKTDSVWCDASVDGKELKLSVTENTGRKIRETQVTLTAATLNKKILVRQLGQNAALLFSQPTFAVHAVGKEVSVGITTNTDWGIHTPDWITADSVWKFSEKGAENTFSFVVQANTDPGKRNGEIVFREKDGTTEARITVYQKGMDKYEAIEEGVGKDIRIKVARAEASSWQPGSEIRLSFDGDKSTFYHSSWNNGAENYFPIALTYYFDNPGTVDYAVYYPRSDGSNNGHFKETEIWAQCAGETGFTKIVDKDFEGAGNAMYVNFPAPLENPGAIRFVIKSGAGDRQGFATCAEMEFYRKNEADFDPLTLFTDATCSELKSGVTSVDIDSCRFPFYKNIALHMLAGTYPAEFRIQHYKAYPHPDLQAQKNKTSPYSRLDNPTGISVAYGEEVVVLAGALNGYSVSLGVQELDTPGKDGYGVTTYPLKEGVNKIKMDKSGLLYVMYHTPDDEQAPEVKLHIASGKVNGYFDISRHTADDWHRLIAQAVNTHFDLLGKYAHLTFPVSALKSYTNNGYDLISLYDELVWQEQVFMGLEKHGKAFKNRMYLHVMYSDSYMYATSYHTAYAKGTLSDILNESKLKTTACWGPAHEVGHCNQTRPGLKWLGTTEVTNNIHSLYIQTLWGNESRLQSESMKSEGYTNRYEKAMNQTFTTGRAHAEEGDVFCKLVPFWQLELYLSKVLGKTDFYKEVYEYVRTNPDLPNAGEQQTEFVYICCLKSGLNLQDFFTRWGFLTPVDITLDDYGSGRLTVTQERVDEIVARIDKLPKPDACFEYITDKSVDVYKKNRAVEPGQASRAGNQLRMTGFSNVVAYEVYDADDRLIFVSPEPAFTIKTAWKEGFKVYALAANGDKTKVNF